MNMYLLFWVKWMRDKISCYNVKYKFYLLWLVVNRVLLNSYYKKYFKFEVFFELSWMVIYSIKNVNKLILSNKW